MNLIENRSAQFMLLAGFIIATGLVITTVILNSLIFEVNTAVGAGSAPSKNEIVNLIQITEGEARNAYWRANKIGGNLESMIIRFNHQMETFNKNVSKIYALHGESVNISWDVNNWKNGYFAVFTENGSADGVQNWTLIESVKNISVFELRNVSGLNFEVNVSNQTTGEFLWSVKLDGIDSIKITNSSGMSASYTVDFTYINLLNTSYNLIPSIGGNTSRIRFINGADASGRYNIIGNTTYGSDFIRARDYILNATVVFSTSRVYANITVPVSVPW